MAGRALGLVQAGLGTAAVALFATGWIATVSGDRAIAAASTPLDLQSLCTPEALQAVASSLATQVTVKQVGNGPFKSATSFVAAAGRLPAYCQVTGSFVTNPGTGKTANFLATFPANWNGKFLQSGCSAHCGQFYVSNPATASVTVTAQGWPGQIIEKGYAHFATDEGHEGGTWVDWAIDKEGKVDREAVEDWLYRADLVLARMGKQFATAFYAKVKGTPQKIARSYFNGCSGGGRDAFVAMSYFPEEYDGIIGGSAYNAVSVHMQINAIGMAAARAQTPITPAQIALVDTLVKAQCDAADGVKDGLIQNPAACNFVAERDLPRCDGDKAGDQCFTKGQVETMSVALSALTDERGNVVQPGYSVSEFSSNVRPSTGGGDQVQKAFVYGNDPKFSSDPFYSFRSGGPGQVTAWHAQLPSSYVAKARQVLGMGIGHDVANTGRFMKARTKFLVWHNFSDEGLTPYMSTNWYDAMARKYGGYAKLESKARLFLIPGTNHCSIGGIAPNSFDALGALEDWVERGKAPTQLVASVQNRQFTPGAPPPPLLKHPNATQLLCRYPTMARYSGKGDVKDAANWSCPAGDQSLLKVGESGRLAGVVR